jgi:hypothetical protein
MKRTRAAVTAETAEWTTFQIKPGWVLVAERPVIAKWTAKEPLGKGWFLLYSGWPHCSKLPRKLQPNGKIGGQYLACKDDAELLTRYAELVAALRRIAPKGKLTGPEPGVADPETVLARKRVRYRVPRANDVTITLERASADHHATHAILGNNMDGTSAKVFSPPRGGTAVVSSMEGRCHLTVRDDGRDILLVTCPRAREKRALANALANAIDEVECGKLVVKARQLVLAPAGAHGSTLAAALKKREAIAIPCTPGTYSVRSGYDDSAELLRLTRR